MRSSLFFMIVLLAVGTTGCFNHQVVPLDQVRQGTDVRVRVTLAEADRLEREAQLQDRVFRGQVLEAPRDGLLLQVPVPGSRSRRSGAMFNRVRIPAEELLEVEVRELSRAKTLGLVGVGVAVVTFAALQAFEATDDPEGEEKEPGEPTRARIPLFGWSIP